ncbi:hypothetical protein XENORESO_021778 [Xenotaenia resolanae]|uniref:Uncharacterized protein n=1 Tax=Xenotaenia resolanae TaxID=208358 RepID=A0ABV0W0G2_9TELE
MMVSMQQLCPMDTVMVLPGLLITVIRMVQGCHAYDRRVPIAPPYGVGPPPAYGYFSRQPSILDPELLLIGNILMRVREMPLARPWTTSEVPVGLTEKPLYPSSLMQSYRGYHQARDLLSNSQYAKDDLEPVPEPETLETQQFVPETGV